MDLHAAPALLLGALLLTLTGCTPDDPASRVTPTTYGPPPTTWSTHARTTPDPR